MPLEYNQKIKALVIDLSLWIYSSILCYKIIWQKLILDLRYPELNFAGILLSILVGVLISIVLYFIKHFSIGKALYVNPSGENVSTFKKGSTYILITITIVTFIAGWIITGISFRELFSPKGFNQAMSLFAKLVSPDFSIIQKVILAAIETIYMALMATLFAIPPAFIISFISAKNLMRGNRNALVYYLARLFMNVVRAIEPLIWAIIFSVWVGIGPFAGMLALMVHSIVSLAKLYSEQIEEMNDGPMEAIKATGASRLLVLWYGIVPQVLNPFLSYTIYRWDINVRMATIIGMVGGGGIGNILMQYQGMALWNQVGTVIFVIAIIVWAMDYLSAKIRERLSKE